MGTLTDCLRPQWLEPGERSQSGGRRRDPLAPRRAPDGALALIASYRPDRLRARASLDQGAAVATGFADLPRLRDLRAPNPKV